MAYNRGFQLLIAIIDKKSLFVAVFLFRHIYLLTFSCFFNVNLMQNSLIFWILAEEGLFFLP
jgi:hypothetical protein